MVSKIVSVGDKIDLIKVKNSIGKNNSPHQYLSQVLDFIDGDKAKISMPIENNRVIPLEIGEKYQLCFYTEKGMYQCNGEIIDRYREEHLFILVVQFISQLEKFQRRQYYRLECILDIDYRVVSQEELTFVKRLDQNNFYSKEEKASCYDALNQLQMEWYPATITDISGGGARFNSTYSHEKDDKLRISAIFPTSNGDKDYELKANVISSIPVANRFGYFEIRVEFSEIELEERETIIKFVFEEERKVRKREKGLV